MELLPLTFFLGACPGAILQGPAATLVQRVCTDSRQVKSGDLFVALAGERFDGHEFLHQAGEQGAAAALVDLVHFKSRPSWESALPLIAVPDTRAALGQIASVYRRRWHLPILAIAGSNGKTTTKELVAAVLRQKWKTLSSPASFNNDIGVPLSLLELDAGHQAAVLEIGTNHPGELEPLVRLIEPQYGILTSLGREHLEFFNDLDGVAEEESWLGRLLPTNGKLFVHGDSPKIEKILAASRARVVRLGASEKNEWQAHHVLMDERGLQFDVWAPDPSFSGRYHLSLLGKHQAVNALFAIALGKELGLSRGQVATGLLECAPPKMRLQLKFGHGFKILDDCYNANADSMRAALQTLEDFPCAGERVAILGDMAELGAASEAAHAEVGRCAAEARVRRLLAVGKMAPVVTQAARAAGLDAATEFRDAEEAAAMAKSCLRPGDVVLIKASRATRLDRVVDLLEASGVEA